ncbi:MAG: hypothetical protein WAT53_02720 [Nitrosomonas sp.]|jgi:hypothetical protein
MLVHTTSQIFHFHDSSMSFDEESPGELREHVLVSTARPLATIEK